MVFVSKLSDYFLKSMSFIAEVEHKGTHYDLFSPSIEFLMLLDAGNPVVQVGARSKHFVWSIKYTNIYYIAMWYYLYLVKAPFMLGKGFGSNPSNTLTPHQCHLYDQK
jgi:hypothetical protein